MASARWFEDFTPGEVIPLGSYTVTEEELVGFARRYDPQPFHVDAEAARRSPFGGLIASGWLTAAIWMRLLVDAVLRDAAARGSPGVEELRWWTPVRPGDTLTGVLRVEAATPSSRRADRGTVVLAGELSNDAGERVLSLRARALFARRAAEEGAI